MNVNTNNNVLPHLSDCNNSATVNQNNTINEPKKKTFRINSIASFILKNSIFACIGSASAGIFYGFTAHNVLIGAALGIVALNVATIALSLILFAGIFIAGMFFCCASVFGLHRHS
jgi:hypothetical protein